MPSPWRGCPKAADRGVVSALAQEHVVGRVGDAFKAACLVAGAIELSTDRVDPLHGRRRSERTVAAPGSDPELQPGNVHCDLPWGGAGDLADHRAAVAVFPGRSGIMPADRLAVQKQRRDRLAKRPGECAVAAALAFINLRAFGMQREHCGFTRSCDGLGKGFLGGRVHERPGEKDGSEYGVLRERHGDAPSLVFYQSPPAKGPRECAPDDRLRTIHRAPTGEMDCSLLCPLRKRCTFVAGNDVEGVGRAAYAGVIALVRFSATLSRKPVVESQRWSAPTRSARSLVMKPASTVSTQTFSSVLANFASSSLLSSLARWASPCVQAKIEAIELVEVSLPFWCSR